MTDFDRLQVQKGVLFKDAVLGLAETKSLSIISEAGKKRATDLEEAYKLAANSDYEVVKNRYIKENEKQFMSVSTTARREILEERQKLVQELFLAVEDKLQTFTKSNAYPAFLTSLLQGGAADIGHDTPDDVPSRIAGFLGGLLSRVAGGNEEDKPTLTVHLRPADQKYTTILQSILPSATFVEDKSIRLGGLKVDDGHIMFDESLDRRLEDAKNRFYESGRMTV